MYEYICGNITGLTPASVIVEAGSIGYFINISINTYSVINGKKEVKLFLHQIVREDAHLLYGFFQYEEREMFRMLILVNGIGSNIALMMLSSLSVDEIQTAILSENVQVLKGIKGIGAKTAQRVIIDLKDKISRTSGAEPVAMAAANNTVREEALSALTMLGFARKNIEKIISQIQSDMPDISIEEMVKQALKKL